MGKGDRGVGACERAHVLAMFCVCTFFWVMFEEDAMMNRIEIACAPRGGGFKIGFIDGGGRGGCIYSIYERVKTVSVTKLGEAIG